MNKHFPLAFSLGDRTLLFTSSECIADMTLPSWKYYSGDLGRSPKEEAVKENLRVGQSEPLRLGTEFSIDSTSMFCKAFELVLQMRGRSGTEQAGLVQDPKGPARKQARDIPACMEAMGHF